MHGIISRIDIEQLRRLPGASLLITLSAGIMMAMPSVADWLQYDRVAVASGEIWRMVTCHFTHWNVDHFVWDVAALAALGALCETIDRRRFLICLAASAVAIPLGVWMFCPVLATYRGLSGIDSAIFCLLAVTLLRGYIADERWSGVTATSAVLVGFLAKIVFEVLTGTTVFVDSRAAEMVPIPLAHVLGAAVGVLSGLDTRKIRAVLSVWHRWDPFPETQALNEVK